MTRRENENLIHAIIGFAVLILVVLPVAVALVVG